MTSALAKYIPDPNEVTGVAVPIDSEVEIRIKENGLGLFQVWKGDKVLRPATLTWENYYQAVHGFMFFSSEKTALKAAKMALNKYTIVKEREIVLR